jgi:tetratricopeptide (TPR) repeat protein
MDLQILYQQGAEARARGDYVQAVLFWQDILIRDPDFQQGTFRPQMVELLRQRALQAGRIGEWQEAIITWKALLQLELQDTQAQEYLPVAEQNQKYTWIYQNAQQFVNKGDLLTGRNMIHPEF